MLGLSEASPAGCPVPADKGDASLLPFCSIHSLLDLREDFGKGMLDRTRKCFEACVLLIASTTLSREERI